MTKRRPFSISWACAMLLLAAAHAVGGPIDRAIDATVYLEVDRLYSGRLVTTSGTAFFINGSGLLLTNEHVIGQTVSLPGGNEVYAKVLKIRAVVNSGTANQREFTAELVADDKENDLALLKVGHRASAWLQVQSSVIPSITDSVWAVGFPLGDLLGMYDERTDRVNRPMVSVNGGRVTSLRRDTVSELKLIQMDAAVNYGNSGGPLVSEDGRLLGIVTAKVGGAAGLGFAVPAREILSFLEHRAFEVRFEPPVIYHGMPPLRVTVSPVLADTDGLTGTVKVDGGNAEDVDAPLRQSGRQLSATLILADHHADAAVGGTLRARVTVKDAEGEEAMHRVFRLRSSSGQSASQPVSARPSAADESSVRRATTGGGGLGGGKLGGVDVESSRRSVPERQSAFVIDNQLMYEREGFLYASWRYERIPDPSDREAALEYEKTSVAIYRLMQDMEELRDRQPSADWDRDPEYRRHRVNLDRLRDQARRQAEVLRSRRVCRCGYLWVMCDDAPCEEPNRPWESD